LNLPVAKQFMIYADIAKGSDEEELFLLMKWTRGNQLIRLEDRSVLVNTSKSMKNSKKEYVTYDLKTEETERFRSKYHYCVIKSSKTEIRQE
jgi:hypothetical protein